MITDAIVLDKLSKFKTPKAIETQLNALTKGLGSQAVRWAVWHKFGSIPAAGVSLAQRLLKKGTQKTEARQAVDFFKGVDNPSFMKSFKEGVRSSKIDEIPNRFKGMQELISNTASPSKRALFDASTNTEEITP